MPEMATDKRYWPEQIAVTWTDAQMEHGETTRFAAKSLDGLPIQTLGWLVHEDERNLVVARDMWVDNDQMMFRDLITIPVRSIDMRGWLKGIKDEDRETPTWR